MDQPVRDRTRMWHIEEFEHVCDGSCRREVWLLRNRLRVVVALARAAGVAGVARHVAADDDEDDARVVCGRRGDDEGGDAERLVHAAAARVQALWRARRTRRAGRATRAWRPAVRPRSCVTY